MLTMSLTQLPYSFRVFLTITCFSILQCTQATDCGADPSTAPTAQVTRVCTRTSQANYNQYNIYLEPPSCETWNREKINGFVIEYNYTSIVSGPSSCFFYIYDEIYCTNYNMGASDHERNLTTFTLTLDYNNVSTKNVTFTIAAMNCSGTGPFSAPITDCNGSSYQMHTSNSYMDITLAASCLTATVMPTTIVNTSQSEYSFYIISPSSSVASGTSDAVTSSDQTTTSKGHAPRGNNSESMELERIILFAGAAAASSLLVCVVVILMIVLTFTVARKRQRQSKIDEVDDDRYATIEMSESTKKEVDDKSFPRATVDSKESESEPAYTSRMAITETGDDDHDNYDHSEKTDNSEAIRTVKNILYESATEPKIIDYKQEMRATEGEQVTLRVNFTGTPKPTITWTFKDNKMEGDYATELGSDGSLMFVCVEMKHAGRYNFVVSNCLGSAEGSVTLTVQDEDGESGDKKKLDFESRLVMVDDYGQYVASLHSGNNNTFILQYQSLVSGEEGKPIVFGLSELNKPLNRFRNIIAYDDHRIPLVPLADVPDCQNDYINASYINGYCQGNEYIASQGPLPNTVTDLWRLVWQEKVKIIAMVTNILEGWTKKCEQYWPEQGSEGKSFGPFNLTLVEEHIFADYTVRTIGIDHTGEEGSCRKVTQYHFTSWPDHGVPEYAGPILNYLRRIKAQHKPNKGPILVHCSAGVGRTGTLIAIDIALAQASKERQVDIPKIIVDMRKQRMKMVQTADQYAFIHDAVLETLICGDTQIPSSDIQRALEKLSKADKQKETGFEKHLKVLDQVSPRPIEVYCEAAMKYPDKNRNSAFLPPEKWRVTLKGETPDYIHASFANGYKQKKGFIIAQSPMENTVRDFVKMIYERECGVVVMLCGCEEGGVEMCAQYWPTSAGTMMKYGEFMVSTVSVNVNEGVTNRVITITDPKSGQVKKVTQFHLEEWSEKDVCSNRRALIDIIDQTGVVQRRTRNKPIVVHGNDTVSRVGVFCSLVNAIEMCKTEGVVDVFQVVKALRIQKPGAVLTVEQYQYIFDLILLFLDSFSIYSNFK